MANVKFQLNIDSGANSSTYQLPSPEAARNILHTITECLSHKGYRVLNEETYHDRIAFVDIDKGSHKIYATFSPIDTTSAL